MHGSQPLAGGSKWCHRRPNCVCPCHVAAVASPGLTSAPCLTPSPTCAMQTLAQLVRPPPGDRHFTATSALQLSSRLESSIAPGLMCTPPWSHRLLDVFAHAPGQRGLSLYALLSRSASYLAWDRHFLISSSAVAYRQQNEPRRPDLSLLSCLNS